MDFLKSAVASAISKEPPFPYKFGDKVPLDQSIWTLCNGTKREDGSDCSIFSFDIPNDRSRLPLARNAVRRMRTLRHPGVIRVLDTVETDTYIYIATERVTPLAWAVRRRSLSDETSKWGLHTIANTLAFINDEAASVHGVIRLSSVYMSQSGEWRLGGLDVLSAMKDDEGIIFRYGSLVPESGRYSPQEVMKSGWDAIKRNPTSAVDSYGFGILVFEVFNGGSINSDQIGSTKNIPPNIQQSYRRLVNANPKARLSVSHFRDQGKRDGGFFQTPLIRLSEGIESLGLKSDSERIEFLKELDSVSDDFPEEFFSVKVLPELLKSVEFGGGGPQVFATVMKIGQKLSEEEWDTKLTPVIVRLFGNPDRAIRVCLLDNLPRMIDHLSQKTINDKIFPNMVTGFSDVAPIVREQTVKAVLTIITKLSDRTINGELLKHLAKTANDEQPGIRTNTTICMGKIARHLGANTRQKVLVAAFSRSLRDPFVHARNAALLALSATADLFTDEDCATKILPSLCPSLVDKEKMVRDAANKAFDTFLQRIRKYATTLPDSVLPPPSTASNNPTPRMGTPQNDASGWAGWAISSFTNKISAANGEMQPTSNATQPIKQERSSSVPPKTDTTHPSISSNTASASTYHRQAVIGASTPSLVNNVTSPTFADEYNDDDEDDAAKAAEDAWDNMGDDTFFDAPADSTKPTAAAPVPYDDGGEPDFEGWLKAQAQAKAKNKVSSQQPARPAINSSVQRAKNQPSVNGRQPVSSSSSSRPGLPSSKTTTDAAIKKVPTLSKTIDTKPKQEDDDWGDAWD